MFRIIHKVTPIEVSRGILTLRKTDGTLDFFSEIKEPFTIILKKKKIIERTVGNKQIWIGVDAMKLVNPADSLRMYKKAGMVYID